MNTLRSLLSSPLWQGIQGFLAIATLIVGILFSLRSTRKLLARYARIDAGSRVARIPWIWIFVALGIVAGVSIGFSYQNLYEGLSVALGSVSIGLAITWLKTQHVVTLVGSELKTA